MARKNNDTAEVVVIGGGASGLMAAGEAASCGAESLLLEKMPRPGLKLRITGKGRCNLTNRAEISEFLPHFGDAGPFLRQAFHRFFVQDLIGFFEERGLSTVTERGCRVFPASGRAQDVVEAILGWARDQAVPVRTRSPVTNLLVEGDCIRGVRMALPSSSDPSLAEEHVVRSKAVILATGGASYTATGSTGDGYRLARDAGHRIVQVRPALVPLETDLETTHGLAGLTLRNVTVRALANGSRIQEAFGEMTFTSFGVSGPVVLTLSRRVVDALRNGRRVELSIDLKPALDPPKLDARLIRDLDAGGKKQVRTLLKGLLPKALTPVCLKATGLPGDRPGHQVTAEDRKRLRTWLKDFRLRVTAHRPFEEAIITAGGVDRSEIDPRTMGSRILQGLYFCGEVIDMDADTGGYNLQAAFSTGWLAGRSAAEKIRRKD
ncbi:MAG: NAD(P)/FAD-dependent oxidoreductase [Desulfobacteraceae bacterium]|jgi:hypothetical protein